MQQEKNPYQFQPPPQAASHAPAADAPMKGGTKAIVIIYLVLGAIGILNSILKIGMIFLQPLIVSMLPQDQEAQMNINPFPGASILNLCISIISFLVSAAMLWGGIKGIQGKLTGWKILRAASLGAIIYKLLELPYTIVMQYFIGQTQAQIANERLSNNPNAPDMTVFFGIVSWMGIAFAVFLAVVLIIFYAFSFLYLGNAENRAQFR